MTRLRLSGSITAAFFAGEDFRLLPERVESIFTSVVEEAGSRTNFK